MHNHFYSSQKDFCARSFFKLLAVIHFIPSVSIFIVGKFVTKRNDTNHNIRFDAQYFFGAFIFSAMNGANISKNSSKLNDAV